MSPAPADYIDVAERIEQFYADYPDGRLAAKHTPFTIEVGDKTWIVYTALAYRTSDDPHPCEGTAWEPVPGKTNFTKDSELMNAETSAWGRAIVAVGYASKGKPIASANEVRNRRADAKKPAAKPAAQSGGAAKADSAPAPTTGEVDSTKPSPGLPSSHVTALRGLATKAGKDADWLTMALVSVGAPLDESIANPGSRLLAAIEGLTLAQAVELAEALGGSAQDLT